MRIVNWNCCTSFGTKEGKEKYKQIMTLDGDIYVIQECEPVEKWSEECKKAIPNYIWEKGRNENGVLVFARPEITLKNLKWTTMLTSTFIPVSVNNQFTLIAVWTAMPGKIEDFYNWQKFHKDKIGKNTVIIGDFNSNGRSDWENEHGNYSHISAVRSLKENGLESVYHVVHNEEQGNETIMTRYPSRTTPPEKQTNEKKATHIDHCFASKDTIVSYEILPFVPWRQHSDHMPIIFERKD